MVSMEMNNPDAVVNECLNFLLMFTTTERLGPLGATD